MELKDFVKHTMLDIATAIKEANDEALSRGVPMKVNPTNIYYRSEGNVEYMPGDSDYDTKQVQVIKFDIAVTTGGTISGEAGGGINVAGIKLGGSGTVSDEHENVSRIAFEVPVVMPSASN